MLGWLELHLDLAPALIIAGFNDGAVPQLAGNDPFLPDSLRLMLDSPNNSKRYARDAYLLEAIRHSRERCTIVAGRHSAQGEPLAPSRLLLACDDQRLVKRIRMVCAEPVERPKPPPVGIAALAIGQQSRFSIPRLPLDLPPPPSMRVTDFRTYLACPYRYALGRLLELQALDDRGMEMDPMQFGNLAHRVLCTFGTDGEMAGCEDAETIAKFLAATLSKEAREMFGRDPLPAVRVQIARLEARLRSVSRFHNLEGMIDAAPAGQCEYRLNRVALVGAKDVGCAHLPCRLQFGVNRIDRNDRTNQWLILDYKTSDSAKSPHKAHNDTEKVCDDGELDWQDLQLPLYWHLATHGELGIGTDDEIQLGYICLPQQTDGACLHLAAWTPAHLRGAIDLARQVVRDIRAGKFEMNPEFDSPFDDFERICHSKVFGEHEPAMPLVEAEA